MAKGNKPVSRNYINTHGDFLISSRIKCKQV